MKTSTFYIRNYYDLHFWRRGPRTYPIKVYYRLQLKRGLFWYRQYPKLHQMVKYGSSQALVWTIRRQITLRVFFIRKNEEHILYGPKKLKNVDFREKNFEKLHASHQSWKKQKFQ